MIERWVIGVLLATLASIVSNLGLNLQKLTHLHNEQRIRQRHRDTPAASPVVDDKAARMRMRSEGDAIENKGSNIAALDLHGALSSSSSASSASTSSSSKGTASSTSSSVDACVGNDQCDRVDVHSDEKKQDESIDDVEPTTMTMTIVQPRRESSTMHDVDRRQQSKSVPLKSLPASPNANRHNPRYDASTSTDDNVGIRIDPDYFVNNHPSSASAPPTFDSYSELSSIDYTKQGLWRLGLALVSVASLLDFAALMFAAQTIVAPLGSLTLVSNTLFAPILLGERVSRRDLMATGAIVAGSVLTVAFADHDDTVQTLQTLFSFFGTLRFMLYAAVVLVAIFVLWQSMTHLTMMKLGDPDKYYSSTDYAAYHRFTYAAIAGLMGAQSVLLAKCVGAILLVVIRGLGPGEESPFRFWQSYAIIAGMIISIFYQINWLNKGLQQFEALFIVPVFQSFWILTSVLGGLIFYGEYRRVFDKPANSILFPIGVIITIAGVIVLSQRGGTEKFEEEDERAEDGTDATNAGAATVGDEAVRGVADGDGGSDDELKQQHSRAHSANESSINPSIVDHSFQHGGLTTSSVTNLMSNANNNIGLDMPASFVRSTSQPASLGHTSTVHHPSNSHSTVPAGGTTSTSPDVDDRFYSSPAPPLAILMSLQGHRFVGHHTMMSHVSSLSAPVPQHTIQGYAIIGARSNSRGGSDDQIQYHDTHQRQQHPSRIQRHQRQRSDLSYPSNRDRALSIGTVGINIDGNLLSSLSGLEPECFSATNVRENRTARYGYTSNSINVAPRPSAGNARSVSTSRLVAPLLATPSTSTPSIASSMMMQRIIDEDRHKYEIERRR